MSTWKCSLCGARGTESTRKGASRAWDHHLFECHRGES
jgi:hypothetical protein